MDEAHQVAPLVTVLDGGHGALAIEAPDFLQDRLQADAVLTLAAQRSTVACGKAVATARSSGLRFF